MTIQAVLLPVFVMVATIFVLLLLTGRRRFAVLRRGEVQLRDVALDGGGWPAGTRQAANAYSSQFELPVLFLVLVALAIPTNFADLVFVVMSWLFVLSRIWHAAVLVTTNHVPTRFRAFLVGFVILALMWAIFVVRIMVGS